MEDKNKTKIAFFLISLYGGGGEKVVLDLAKGFSLQGYDVDLLLFSRKGVLENQIYKDINVVDLKVKRIFFSIFPLIKYLKKEKPLFILGTSEHANIILLLAKLISITRTKFLLRVGMRFENLFKNYNNKRDRLLPFLIKYLYPKADGIIANSYGVANDLSKKLKIPLSKVNIIYNPKFIEEIEIKSKQGEWKYSEKQTILSVGRLEKQKDFETLIRAFALARQKIDAQLIILGEGGEREKLNNLIQSLNLRGDVYLKGFVENPYFFMKKADVFVSSSLWEGFSNVLIEAGILGLPIIATDCGSGSRELLAPKSDFNKQLEKGRIEYADNGILVAKQDINMLAEAILILSEDDLLRDDYSKKIKEKAKEFEVSKILKEYKKLIGDGCV